MYSCFLTILLPVLHKGCKARKFLRLYARGRVCYGEQKVSCFLVSLQQFCYGKAIGRAAMAMLWWVNLATVEDLTFYSILESGFTWLGRGFLSSQQVNTVSYGFFHLLLVGGAWYASPF